MVESPGEFTVNTIPVAAIILISIGITSSLSPIAFAEESAGELNFDYFKNEVQPVFLAKRNNNIRCIQYALDTRHVEIKVVG